MAHITGTLELRLTSDERRALRRALDAGEPFTIDIGRPPKLEIDCAARDDERVRYDYDGDRITITKI